LTVLSTTRFGPPQAPGLAALLVGLLLVPLPGKAAGVSHGARGLTPLG
jgi:hypothetical protein